MGIDLQDQTTTATATTAATSTRTTPRPRPGRSASRLFGKDHDDEAGLEGYVGDEAFERALIADEEAEAARAAGGARPAPSRAAQLRRARRAPSHPGRDRRRKDQGRPGPRHAAAGAAAEPAENATEAIPLVTPGMVAAGSLNPAPRTGCRRRGRRREGPLQPRGPGAAAHPDSAAHRTALAGRRRHLHPAGVGRADPGFHPQGTHRGQRRDCRLADRNPQPVQRGRPGHRLQPRPHRHPLRDRTLPGHQGGTRHRAVQEHLLRRRQLRRAHPEPHPGQVGHRHRDPQHGPRDRVPGRRAPQPERPPHRPPDGHGRRQGRRGRLRRGQPRQDAAPARRRRHRRRQVLVRELDDHLHPDARHPGRGPHGHGGPQARGTHRLRGRPAPHHPDHHQPEEGGRGPAVGGPGDGRPLRRPRQLRLQAHRRLQQGRPGRQGPPAGGFQARHPAVPVPAGDRGRTRRPDDGRPARRRRLDRPHHAAGPCGRHPPGAGHPAARRSTSSPA